MNNYIKYIGLILIFFIIFISCKKDFEDINHNPHGFTTASDGSLFNSTIQSLVLSGNEQFYINNEILYKQTQLAALTQEAWGNFSLGTEEMWNNYYRKLPNFRELEKRFEEHEQSAELTNMKAMVKILLAFKTFKLTDLFGDLPFEEAGFGFEDLEYLRPKFDSQYEIYTSLLEDLKWCDENIDISAINQEPFTTFSSFDPLFNGNMLEWLKFANSMRLRYAMRMSEKEPELAGQIIKEVVDEERPVFLGYDFITYLGESACLWPARMGFSNSSLNWSFREHKNLRMGSNIWHQFSKHDSTDGSGIFDPRAYIFFEGNNDNKWVSYPQKEVLGTPISGGVPYNSHRDGVATFKIKGTTCIYSPFNYFLIADINYMPIPLFTGAEVHFLIAEAYLRGIGVPKNSDLAETEYLNGINASVKWWQNVAENSKLPNSDIEFSEKISIPANTSAAAILNKFGFWNAISEEEKLRFIYTQRWIDAFRQPWEAYSLTRRTGKTPREGEAIKHFRLPYPDSEIEYNVDNFEEALSRQGGGHNPEFKIWWIP